MEASFPDGRSPLPSPRAQSEGPGSPKVPGGTAYFDCAIDELAILENRMHFHCTAAPGGTTIRYYTYPMSGAYADQMNRFLLILNNAYSLGKPVTVQYDTDTAHNYPDCLAANCRNIVALFIYP